MPIRRGRSLAVNRGQEGLPAVWGGGGSGAVPSGDNVLAAETWKQTPGKPVLPKPSVPSGRLQSTPEVRRKARPAQTPAARCAQQAPALESATAWPGPDSWAQVPQLPAVLLTSNTSYPKVHLCVPVTMETVLHLLDIKWTLLKWCLSVESSVPQDPSRSQRLT